MEQDATGYLVAVDALKPLNAVAESDDNKDGDDLAAKGCAPVKQPRCVRNNNETKWFALVERGGCSFIDKARAMQKSGASAMVVGDNEQRGGLVVMFAAGDVSDVAIPCTFIQQWSYRDLRYLSYSHRVASVINDNDEQCPGYL